MQRIEQWVAAYHDFLVERANAPFAWGVNDCALFAADGIHAATGVDIAADFRGQYADEAGAWAAIERIAGGKSVADAAAWCAARHGLPELEYPLMAQRGDLVVFPNGGNLIAGLVHLNGSRLVSVTDKGLWYFGIQDVVRAWRV